MTFNAAESTIVQGFQAFYYELLRQKEKALSLYFFPESSSNSENQANENPEDNSVTDGVEGCVVSIQKKLLAMLENITNMILAKSRISSKLVSDAKYVMAVLADEIFLNLNWEGKKFWRYTLLEKQSFQTELAGDKFFSMLDEVISDLSNEEIAFIYLMALSLGFKGRYRDIDNADEHINWYKEKLLAILTTHHSSKLYFPGRTHMIETCYESTYIEKDQSKIPDSVFWTWSVVAVFFAYIIISYIVWSSITSEISSVLDLISEQTRQGPLV